MNLINTCMNRFNVLCTNSYTLIYASHDCMIKDMNVSLHSRIPTYMNIFMNEYTFITMYAHLKII